MAKKFEELRAKMTFASREKSARLAKFYLESDAEIVWDPQRAVWADWAKVIELRRRCAR